MPENILRRNCFANERCSCCHLYSRCVPMKRVWCRFNKHIRFILFTKTSRRLYMPASSVGRTAFLRVWCYLYMFRGPLVAGRWIQTKWHRIEYTWAAYVTRCSLRDMAQILNYFEVMLSTSSVCSNVVMYPRNKNWISVIFVLLR